MVCIPCIVIPFCLWIFHRFIRPVLLKIWNPWSQKKVVNDKSTSPPKKSVDLKTKSEENEVKIKNIQNGIAESKKISPSEPIINTKTLGDSAFQPPQEKCVSDKKRD